MPEAIKGDIDPWSAPTTPPARSCSEFAVVREPPDLHALADALPGGEPHRWRSDHDALSALARRAGRSLVPGGPGFDHLRDSLLGRVQRRAGRIDAVIVVRDRPTDLGSGQSAATDSARDWASRRARARAGACRSSAPSAPTRTRSRSASSTPRGSARALTAWTWSRDEWRWPTRWTARRATSGSRPRPTACCPPFVARRRRLPAVSFR